MNINGVHRLSSQLQLQRTHPAHYSSREETAVRATDAGRNSDATAATPSAPRGGFADLLREGLGAVNQAEQTHAALAAQAITNPEQVDAHDVTIAAAKADLSIRLAKNIIDSTLSAYREITSLR